MVTWTAPAKQDLRQIYDYIARDSKFYAQRVSQEIVERSEKLDAFPEIGRIVPEINQDAIREVFVFSYRLIYEISSGSVQVLALIHGRRLFSAEYLKERSK